MIRLTKHNDVIILSGKSMCVGVKTITKEMIKKAKLTVQERKNHER